MLDKGLLFSRIDVKLVADRRIVDLKVILLMISVVVTSINIHALQAPPEVVV